MSLSHPCPLLLSQALGLYKPVVYEYSKMVLTYIQLSKRHLQLLVYGGHVDNPKKMFKRDAGMVAHI